jgi:hypothetical protein
MTTAKTRSPWIKRAVIGATAALMLGGGIGVAANAAPGEGTTVTGRGDTEEAAIADAQRQCAAQGQSFVPFSGHNGSGGSEATGLCQ